MADVDDDNNAAFVHGFRSPAVETGVYDNGCFNDALYVTGVMDAEKGFAHTDGRRADLH